MASPLTSPSAASDLFFGSRRAASATESTAAAPLPANEAHFSGAVALCLHDTTGRLLPVNTDVFFQEYHSVAEVTEYLTQHIFPLDVVCYNLIQWRQTQSSELADEKGERQAAIAALAVGHIPPLRDCALSELEPVTSWPPSCVFHPTDEPAPLNKVRVIHIYALSSLSARHKELNRELLHTQGRLSATPFPSLHAAMVASGFAKAASSASLASASTANLTASITSWQVRQGLTHVTSSTGKAGSALSPSTSSAGYMQLPRHGSSVSLGIVGSPLRLAESDLTFSPSHSFASQTMPPAKTLMTAAPAPAAGRLQLSHPLGSLTHPLEQQQVVLQPLQSLPPGCQLPPARSLGLEPSISGLHPAQSQSAFNASFPASSLCESSSVFVASSPVAIAAPHLPGGVRVDTTAASEAGASPPPSRAAAATGRVSPAPHRCADPNHSPGVLPVAPPAADPSSFVASTSTVQGPGPHAKGSFPAKVGVFVEARVSGQSRYSRRSDTKHHNHTQHHASAGPSNQAALRLQQPSPRPHPSASSITATPVSSAPVAAGVVVGASPRTTSVTHAPSIESQMDSLAAYTPNPSFFVSPNRSHHPAFPVSPAAPSAGQGGGRASPRSEATVSTTTPAATGAAAANCSSSVQLGPGRAVPRYSQFNPIFHAGTMGGRRPNSTNIYAGPTSSSLPASAPAAGSSTVPIAFSGRGYSTANHVPTHEAITSAGSGTALSFTERAPSAAQQQQQQQQQRQGQPSNLVGRVWNNPVPPLAKSTITLAMALHINDVEPLERLLTHYTCYEKELLERTLFDAHPFLQSAAAKNFMATADPRAKAVIATTTRNTSTPTSTRKTVRDAPIDEAEGGEEDADVDTGLSTVRDGRCRDPRRQQQQREQRSTPTTPKSSKSRRSRATTRSTNDRERLPELFRCYFRHLRTAQENQWNMQAVMHDPEGLAALLLPQYCRTEMTSPSYTATVDSSADNRVSATPAPATTATVTQDDDEGELGDDATVYASFSSKAGSEWERKSATIAEATPHSRAAPKPRRQTHTPGGTPQSSLVNRQRRFPVPASPPPSQLGKEDQGLCYQGEVMSNDPLTLPELRGFLTFTPDLAARLQEAPLSEMDQARRAQVAHLQRQYGKLASAVSSEANSRSQSHMQSPPMGHSDSPGASCHGGACVGNEGLEGEPVRLSQAGTTRIVIALQELSEAVALRLLRGAKDNLAMAMDALHYLAWRDIQEGVSGANAVTPDSIASSSNPCSHNRRHFDVSLATTPPPTATMCTPESSTVAPRHTNIPSATATVAVPVAAAAAVAHETEVPGSVVNELRHAVVDAELGSAQRTTTPKAQVAAASTTATVVAGEALTARSSLYATPGITASVNSSSLRASSPSTLVRARATRPLLSAFSAGASFSALPPERSHATMQAIEKTLAASAWMAGIEKAVRERQARVECVARIVSAITEDPNAIAALWYTSEGEAMQAFKVVVQAVVTASRR